MLRIFLCSCLLLVTVFNSYAQTPSSCNRSTIFNTTFEEDVKELAIIDMLASGTADSNSITVIASYEQPIFDALAAVANTANVLSEADSVFNLYCIHNDRQVNSMANYELYVDLDPSVAWTANWISLSTPSGNTTIDNLLAGNTYSLSKPFSSMPNFIVLTFNEVVNIKPIVEQLTGLNGINYISGVPLTGDGNKITHTNLGNISYLDFTLGWDDCSAGCIKKRTWSFSVDLATCSVSYLGAIGNDPSSFNFSPPFQPGCNILLSNSSIPKEATTVEVFPNPTSNLVHIEGAVEQLELYNSMGVLVLDQSVSSILTTLDLSHLAQGIYLLVVNDTITKTVVKQ